MSSEAKENAKRAMRELFGNMTGEAIEPVEPVEQEEELNTDLPKDLPKMPEENVAMFQSPAKTEITKISSDTIITGTVKTSGTIEIHGTIYGDVYSGDNVYLYGRVAGNVESKNFCHYAGAVKGNVVTADHVEIGRSGAILGDITAPNVRLDGRVSGNIVSTGKVELLEDAIVLGDINTRYFTMKDSARLRGMVRLEGADKDVDSAFTDCFNF